VQNSLRLSFDTPKAKKLAFQLRAVFARLDQRRRSSRMPFYGIRIETH
jgi:hypothetical protein